MLHPYQEALRKEIPFDKPHPDGPTGRELLMLLCGVNDWLETVPSIHSSLHGTTLYILYRDTAFVISDLWELYGPSIANVNRVWPASVFGTAANQETVRLLANWEGSVLRLMQESISGQPTDILNSLCLQIDCADKDDAEKLVRFFTAIRWQSGIAAASWGDADFFRRQGLAIAPAARSRFCYTGLGGEASPGDFLRALDFGQKITLWTEFLRERLEPEEFEWLADEMAEGTIAGRMEWELTLREAMEQAGYRVVNGEKAFDLYDGAGKKVYFGADDRCPAGWALLKILFPLNYQ